MILKNPKWKEKSQETRRLEAELQKGGNRTDSTQYTLRRPFSKSPKTHSSASI